MDNDSLLRFKLYDKRTNEFRGMVDIPASFEILRIRVYLALEGLYGEMIGVLP